MTSKAEWRGMCVKSISKKKQCHLGLYMHNKTTHRDHVHGSTRREQHAKKTRIYSLSLRAKLSCRQGKAGSLEDTQKREDTMLCFVTDNMTLLSVNYEYYSTRQEWYHIKSICNSDFGYLRFKIPINLVLPFKNPKCPLTRTSGIRSQDQSHHTTTVSQKMWVHCGGQIFIDLVCKKVGRQTHDRDDEERQRK